MAIGALGLLEQHFHVVADADLEFVAPGGEFVDRHQAFGLVADINDDVVRCDRDHLAGDDLSLVEMTHAVVVHLDELLIGEVVCIWRLRFAGKRVGRVFFGGFHEFLCSRFGCEPCGGRFQVGGAPTIGPQRAADSRRRGPNGRQGSDGQV